MPRSAAICQISARMCQYFVALCRIVSELRRSIVVILLQFCRN